MIVRRLLGLEDVISLGVAGPRHDERSWSFETDPGGIDPVLGITWLRDAYERRFPGYPKGITVPAMVEVATGEVVTNDFAQMTRDLSSEWTAHHRPGAPDLWPEAEMDELMAEIYRDLNNGVYRAGFAGDQGAYQEAYSAVFASLDRLSERLERRRYLMGDSITEADVRLWPTLVRFDAVYHGHFKCNRQKLSEMPVLWGYAKDLFQTPGFGDTIDFAQIKEHYYGVHRSLNPSGIVPVGPDVSNWLSPHDRDELGGTPFGTGTPPGPPPTAEA
jgi:putative glutathione S-transferase